MQKPLGTFASGALPWLKKGTWTILDQGLFAGSNFLLSVLLARWLTPREYGAFTVAFTIFLLIGTAHTGLLTEPMLVFGPDRHKNRLGQYISVLLRGHVGFSLAAAAGLAIGGVCTWLCGSQALARALLTLAVAQPFILFSWLVRRSFYIELAPKWSAIAGALYAALMLAGTYAVYRMSLLSPSWALAVMSGASLVAGIWVLSRLHAPVFARPEEALASEVVRQHWGYGRWAMATGVIMWIPGQLPFVILSMTAGLEQSAALKALRNLAMPAAHTYSALFVLLVPAFVHARMRGKLNRYVTVSLLVVAVSMAAYWVFLAAAGPAIMVWLYSGQYTEFRHMLWMVGAQPVVAGVAAVLGAALRALERPNDVFWAYLGTSLGVVTIGMALIVSSGVLGAIIGYIVCNLVGIGLMLYLLGKSRPGGVAKPSAEQRPAG